MRPAGDFMACKGFSNPEILCQQPNRRLESKFSDAMIVFGGEVAARSRVASEYPSKGISIPFGGVSGRSRSL
jgi:hypothetical protein